MKSTPLKIVKAILFLGIALYLSLNFESSLENLVMKTPIGWFYSSIILRLAIAFAFARGFQLLILVLKPKAKSVLLFTIGAVLGFGINFGFAPIYATDYGDLGQSDMGIIDSEMVTETNGMFDLQGKPAVIAFFTSGCPHCKAASKKLGQALKNDRSPQVIALFPGSIADANSFINENNGQQFTTLLIENDDYYLTTSGASFPSLFLVDENCNTIQHWFGDEMNYNALDLISDYK